MSELPIYPLARAVRAAYRAGEELEPRVTTINSWPFCSPNDTRHAPAARVVPVFIPL